MESNNYRQAIEKWFEAHKDEMIEAVGEPQSPTPRYPARPRATCLSAKKRMRDLWLQRP